VTQWAWEDAQAPDVVGRILACRMWGTDRYDIAGLSSTGVDYRWVGPGPHTALCVTSGIGRAYCDRQRRMDRATRIEWTLDDTHPPVVQRICGCGFWGLSSWAHLGNEFGFDPSEVIERDDFHSTYSGMTIGLVALWGRVVPGRRGWRAQYAQVTAVSNGRVAKHLGVHHLRELRDDVLTPPMFQQREAS
jgi:hypothetical protein